MKKQISKELMLKAAQLSSEWNNTGFIVLNHDGSLSATVWNHYKWEKDEEDGRMYIATINGNEGFKIVDETEYEWEISPDEILKQLSV